MKTTIILAAAAAAFLFTGAPTFAADMQENQTQVKRCYRTVHKLPFRVRVPCRKQHDMKLEPMRPAPLPAPPPKKTS